VYAVQQDTVSTEGLDFQSLDETAPADTVKAAADTVAKKTPVKEATKAVVTEQKQGSLLTIFIEGFLGGFAALIMPCIFPMLPLTVSFFTKKAKSKGAGISKAVIYGLSIIVIYTVFGLIITAIFGADALNDLSTNGVFNFLFFLLLVVFAASFLGAFEITLPASWVNKMDSQSDRGGFAGLFFMAATLALVSFSCTGPIIGTLLVQAATSGALLGPAIGMFGFSLALAIPFALFAMFPSWLSSLPKSGGWLNSVKVVLGFLELALAFKFLSNVDLAYHWEWFDREIFLVLWIVIFGMMGLYLLGKLRFSHDSEVSYISVPRLFLAIIVLAFTMYMIPGLWGAPLKSISAFLPPRATQDFDLSATATASATATNSDSQPRKYTELFHAPKGFNPYFDYEQGREYARQNHKPVMIDFTGHACVNCREMEENVWPDADVKRTINEDFVLIQLYVDDKTDLAAAEQITTPEGKKLTTIGKKWSWFQASKFKANSQPFYVLMDPETEEMLVPPSGSDDDPKSYLAFLQRGLAAYKGK
ncbi:MAG: thioredoxin family protein, partial [Mucilaginibacter polytrichastri]|nr:thioredoxin family protein [Mucilaginibacter polytrichastri]